MKFLESKEVEVKKGKIAVIFKPVTPLNQSALLGYQAELSKAVEANDIALNVQAQMKTVAYALNEMIDSLIVDEVSYNPQNVAACANAADPDTFDTLKAIYDMTTGLLVAGHTKKKSSTQRKPTSKASAVKDAQVQIKE